MANSKVVYGMGQYRYTTANKYADIVQEYNNDGSGNSNAPEETTPPGAREDSVEFSYRDIKIKLPDGGTFDTDSDYYLSLNIPRDISVGHTINVYLGTSEDPTASKLQPVRRIYVPKSYIEGDSGLHYMAIYQIGENGEVQSDEFRRDDFNWVNGVAESLKVGDSTTSLFNYAALNESWRSNETSSELMNFEMVFRPVIEGFNCIYLSIVRTAEDYKIKRREGVSGYQIDPKKVTYSIEKLAPFLASEGGCMPPIPNNTLTRIGVWSRPGLMMAINGEEIHVGQSGYYELDAIPITSLAIYAKNFYNDNFSIDYQYIDSITS